MQDPDIQPPVNPLPPAVILMFLAIAGVEAGLTLGEAGLIGGPGAVGWRLGLIRDFAFSGEIFDWMLANGQWPLSEVRRLVTYPFVHLGFTHGLFAMVLLLALGKMVAEVMGQVAFVAIFILSGVAARRFMRCCSMIRCGWPVPTQCLWADRGLFLCDVAASGRSRNTAISGVLADCGSDGHPTGLGRVL